jgi:maleylpyruvate isomerase
MQAPPTEPAGAPLATMAGCAAAHTVLIAHLATIDDVVLRRPSLLPDWSIGHVLTHLARNADSFVRMLEAASMGDTVPQYPGGQAQRSGDIEGGATRPAATVVNDVRLSAERLDTAFRQAPDTAWDGRGGGGDGYEAACRDFPLRRWREVEFHLVDLGLGYDPVEWPAEFVALVLPETLAAVPDRIAHPQQRAALLAWLSGRSESPGKIDFGPL